MKKKIMVVDDTADTVELTKAVLEMSGFQVIGITDPNKVIPALEKSLPDIMILDVRMPTMSGPDLCAKIRENKKYSNLKIAFFTASSDADMTLIKKYNVLGFIFKPFDNADLVKQINKYLGS